MDSITVIRDIQKYFASGQDREALKLAKKFQEMLSDSLNGYSFLEVIEYIYYSEKTIEDAKNIIDKLCELSIKKLTLYRELNDTVTKMSKIAQDRYPELG